MITTDAVVVGAGPYGLAAAAHLSGAGLQTHVFGDPMSFWREQMPKGMLLRSPWQASHISDPGDAYTLDAFYAEQGWEKTKPTPLDKFVAYGRWFQRQVLPQHELTRIRRVGRAGDRFLVEPEHGPVLQAGRVVIATGISRYARRPAMFTHLPREVASHPCDETDLGRFAGRRVLVIGGGQSALESAALLHENGADVEVIVRAPQIHWLSRSARLHKLGPLSRALYAGTDVGPAVVSKLVAAPGTFRRFPRRLQDKMATRSIRPAGAAWLRPRLEGVVPLRTGLSPTRADLHGDLLQVKLDDGSTRDVHNLLYATGYRVDVSRSLFPLDDDLHRALDVVDGYPRLGEGFETSVPGLHVLGAPAAYSFGPINRFVAGTTFAASSLAAVARCRP